MTETGTNLPVVFLMGPTASGKTGLALELLRRLPMDIVSVDSAMVYRGMDIGTAKPAPEILARIPHRLIDIRDPAQAYSAGRFREDAQAAIAEIHALGRIPLLVGGSGLYFRSLEQGISALPPADPEIRARLALETRELGLDKMHERLARIDADTARRIHRHDPQRIQRALEVFEITGRSLSTLFTEGRDHPLPNRIMKVIIAPNDRGIIHGQVKQRFLEMLEFGFIDEVRRLYERGDLDASMPAMRMVGYRQIWRHLDGQIEYREMVEHAIVATRQLAKRQLTWLRRERDGIWFDSVSRDLVDKITEFLLNDPEFCVLA